MDIQELTIAAFREKISNLIVLQPRLTNLTGLDAVFGPDVNIAGFAKLVEEAGASFYLPQGQRIATIDREGLIPKDLHPAFVELLRRETPIEVGLVVVRNIPCVEHPDSLDCDRNEEDED